MLVKVVFYFFGRWLSDNSNAVIVDFNAWITLTVPVFGFGYHDFLYELVYQFGYKLGKLRYPLCLVNEPL